MLRCEPEAKNVIEREDSPVPDVKTKQKETPSLSRKCKKQQLEKTTARVTLSRGLRAADGGGSANARVCFKISAVFQPIGIGCVANGWRAPSGISI